MKKPTLRVTKWVADIPVEAHCTQCLTVSFKAQGVIARTAKSIRSHCRPSLMCTVRRCIPKRD